jgi:D-serine deaminase-like pyridoxal phosphate-dependent protein
MSAPWYFIANEEEIASPALLIYRERVDANVSRMLEIAGGPGRLWPHVKTHKLAPLVKAQLDRGITRFKCATVAEAEMTASAGAAEVLLAMQPVGPAVRRLIELIRHFPATAFSTLADAEAPVLDLAAATRSASLDLPVWLDIDCGTARTGTPPGPEADRLYHLLAQTKGLRAAGLHAYDGHLHNPDLEKRTNLCTAAFESVLQMRTRLEQAGFGAPPLIAGGTPTFAIHARHADRLLSPGTSVLWDFGYGDKFPDLPFAPAALLLTRVISKPGRNRLCLDLGHKAVAAENPHPRVRFLELPDAAAITHSEEHLVIETERAAEFRLGQTLHGIPRHVCPTVALYSEACVIEGGAARDRWPITARARRITV